MITVAMLEIPLPELGHDGRYRTIHNGDEAAWEVDNGVIRVDCVNTKDGQLELLHGLPLSECFDSMPRKLWDEIRHDYERLRDAQRGSAWSCNTA